jgi:hypothetical protein
MQIKDLVSLIEISKEKIKIEKARLSLFINHANRNSIPNITINLCLINIRNYEDLIRTYSKSVQEKLEKEWE